MLKEKGTCWSCLPRGHRLLECKKKRPCGVIGCTKDEKIETSLQEISGSASVCDNNIADSCLLQIQRIPAKRDWVNVLWDSGASLCFITNDKAKAERLKGTKVELSIIKVRGDNEKITSTRCKLSLIDEQGREVQFDVYGIDKGSSDIQSVNVKGIVKLFKNISKEEDTRSLIWGQALRNDSYCCIEKTSRNGSR